MAKITRILAANSPRQFFFVINTTASTRCWVENFQLINYLLFTASKCHVRIQRQWQFKMFKMAERSDSCSGKTLLAPCTRKKRLQIKMTKDQYWVGAQENFGMFSKS